MQFCYPALQTCFLKKLFTIFLLIQFLLGYRYAMAQPSHQLYEQLTRAVSANQITLAVETADKLIIAAKKQFGQQHDSVYNYLMMAGYVFYNNNHPAQSLPYYREALPFHKKTYGEGSTEYQDLLVWVANTLFAERQFKTAEPYYEMFHDYRLKKYGATDSMYISALVMLSSNRNYSGKRQEALSGYLQAKAWFDQHNIRTADYAYLLSWLGNLELGLGNLTAAEHHILTSQNIYDSLGQHDQMYQQTHSLAIVYSNMGLFKKSEVLYDRLLAYYPSVPGNELNYASALTEKARFHVLAGRYAKAEELMKEALVIRRNHQAPPEDIANSTNELANLYIELGNIPEAEAMFRQSLALREKRFGKDEVYALYLHNLAVAFSNAGRYGEALTKEEEAGAIIGRIAPGSTDHLNSLQYHAYLLLQLGKIKESGAFIQQALAAHQHPSANNSYPHELYMVAGIYYQEIKDYAAAINWFEKAHDLNVQLYGKQNLQSRAVNRLTMVNRLAGNYEKAFYWQQQTNDAVKKKIAGGIEFLSEAELVRLSADVNFTDGPALIAQYGGSSAAAAMLYDNMLLIKGLSLNNQAAVADAIYASGDTTLIRLWNDNRDLKRLIHEQEQMNTSKRSYDTDSLSSVAKENEKLLVKRSKLIGESNAFLESNWKSVQQKLKPGSCAIEFVRYTNGSIRKDSAMYAAVLIRATDTVPQFVPLCTEDQLLRLMQRFQQNNGDIYLRSLNIGSKGPMPSATLYNLVWKPLASKLADINTIYFSPDGLLHKVAFAALPVDDSTLLHQRYQLTQLFSTRTINSNDGDEELGKVILMGGIDYTQSSTTGSKNNSTTDPLNFVIRNRSSEMSSFNYLPGTLQEVNYIAAVCADKSIRHTLFTGKHATEAAFRQLSGNAPSVIHVSTHGFSLPDNTRTNAINNRFTAAADPLVRCGLVLAGGNNAWKGTNSNAGNDGILTGKEISTLNFRGCKLAILSACETGLGSIEGTEGVFGLQRALRMAGVQSIIVSLWPVPDKETVEFMQLFYTDWFATGSKEKAFRNAQVVMQKKYAASQWAAFVMIQ